MNSIYRQAAFLALFAGLAGSAQAGIYFETGDSGRLPAGAQTATGTGLLDYITGSLDTSLDVDMFRIYISDPASFLAMTLETVPGDLLASVSDPLVSDPQLFLFDASGKGVYMNDDMAGAGSQSMLPSPHPLAPAQAGFYFLAIGWFDNEPFTSAGRVFENGIGTTGPDSASAGLPVISWNDDVSGRIDLPTSYVISFRGITAIPEPSTLALAGIAVLFLAGRRR